MRDPMSEPNDEDYAEQARRKHDPEDDEPGMICPVTSQPCLTEQDEFCEDYGCARKAGIDVERTSIL